MLLFRRDPQQRRLMCSDSIEWQLKISYCVKTTTRLFPITSTWQKTEHFKRLQITCRFVHSTGEFGISSGVWKIAQCWRRQHRLTVFDGLLVAHFSALTTFLKTTPVLSIGHKCWFARSPSTDLVCLSLQVTVQVRKELCVLSVLAFLFSSISTRNA